MVRKVSLVLMAVAVLAATAVFMQARGGQAAGIAFDAESACATGNGASFTWSHTVGSGNDRFLLVGLSLAPRQNQKVASVTYAGQPLSVIAVRNNANESRVEVWQMVAPPTGTANVVVTMNAATAAETVCGATSWSGVDQTDPIGSIVEAKATSNLATASVALTSGEIVHDVLAASGDTGATVGAGQTERWNGAVSAGVRGAGSDEAGSGTITMSWNLAASVRWVLIAVAINPAANGSPTDTPTATPAPTDTPVDVPGAATVRLAPGSACEPPPPSPAGVSVLPGLPEEPSSSVSSPPFGSPSAGASSAPWLPADSSAVPVPSSPEPSLVAVLPPARVTASDARPERRSLAPLSEACPFALVPERSSFASSVTSEPNPRSTAPGRGRLRPLCAKSGTGSSSAAATSASSRFDSVLRAGLIARHPENDAEPRARARQPSGPQGSEAALARAIGAAREALQTRRRSTARSWYDSTLR